MRKLLLLFLLVANLFAVNINTASLKELQTLHGIGERTAKAIIEYRKAHKFKDINELMNVRGIGKKKFNRIKDELSI